VLLNPVILRLFDANRVETQVRLVQAQKMEAIGTLAGGIAHDLNNILTPIIGYTRLMREMMAAGEPLDPEMLDQVLVSGIRAQETVARILAFSRHQKTEQRVVSLSEMVKEVVKLIGGSLPATIDTELCLEAADDAVFANPVELHQVIMNLCTNSYHAMRDKGGHLQLSLADHHGPLLGWSLHHKPLTDSMLRLTVRDTGDGIPSEILPKIFEPFFTTKKQGEGTGMGLAIVHGVVSRCRGAVSIETTMGQGTAFHIYLPRHVCSPALNGRSEIPFAMDVTPESGQRRMRVLYVDDEFPVTRLAQRYLSRFGLDVETENDSVKALSTLRTRMGDFDVLVTDQTMPSITGLELAQKALKLNPRFPVIMCTGFSETVSPEMAKIAGICGYMHKPTDYAKMAAIIRSCHDGCLAISA
jgi:nitrogen-specific signal transduction histidine kinase/ActR/RegA family two-component response regulator